MTMEMWTLGFTMPAERLALMRSLAVPLLTGFARYGGFRRNIGLCDSIIVIHALGLMLASLVLLHAFVYALDFKGQHDGGAGTVRLPSWLSLTLPGYAPVLLTSLLVLWLFGRTDGLEPAQALHMTAVLALPGALGAATARLVLRAAPTHGTSTAGHRGWNWRSVRSVR